MWRGYLAAEDYSFNDSAPAGMIGKDEDEDEITAATHEIREETGPELQILSKESDGNIGSKEGAENSGGSIFC